jgi:hypothetical protein
MVPGNSAGFSDRTQRLLNPVARTAIATVAIVACLLLVWISARFGFSRLMSRYANLSASLPAANEAVQMAPHDPEARRVRGAVLRYLGQLAEAAKEYEMAVSLRPLDDLLWLELGLVREESGDQQGALAALNESVRTAPFYASPRWQRGNVLLRMQRYDEGFADLLQAAASDQELQPNLIDLAWGLSRADLKLTEQILQIDNPQMRLSYARFLARKGLGQEVVKQVRGLAVPDLIRKEMVSHLITKKSFGPAFELWSNASAGEARKGIFDGGFEAPLSFDETGFGWRVAGGEMGLGLAVDQSEKQTGMRSLRIQFNGNSNPGIRIVSQLMPVEPLKRYRLNFASRSQDVMTGGLPIVMVSDATDERILGKAEPIREGTHGWKVQGFEFSVGEDENAVIVSLRRQNCAITPCPIFGMVWLDSFSIEELN